MTCQRLTRHLIMLMLSVALTAEAGLVITSTKNLALVEEQGVIEYENDLSLTGTSFSKDEIGVAPHTTEHVNDGAFGNANSWIGGSTTSFVGVSLDSVPRLVNQIAFGRDNEGVYADRCIAVYQVQYTTVANPDASTPDASWTTIGSLDYQSAGGVNFASPALRHRFTFDPVFATGFRLKITSTSELICVDELEIYPAPLPAPTLLTTGGSFSANNLATAATSTAFAKDVIGVAPHATANVRDGTYGNASSWIGGSADSFIGINLGATPVEVAQLAFGRDNSGTYTDRTAGTYTFQYTTVPNPDENTPDTSWTDFAQVTYPLAGDATPGLRHLYSFTPVTATGVRVRVLSSAAFVAIDELELYKDSANIDATLSSLSSSAGALSPSFASNTTSYALPAVLATASSITVTPSVAQLGATVKVNGTTAVSGSPFTVALAPGANTITVLVTAADGTTTRSYTLAVVRAFVTLSGLSSSAGALNPVFDGDTTSYTLPTVPVTTTSITVTPSVAQSGETLKVNGTTAVSGSPFTVALAPGANTITTLVTAADGTTTRSYTLSVIRDLGMTLVEQGGSAGQINLAKEIGYMTATSSLDDTLRGPYKLRDSLYGDGNGWVSGAATTAVVARLGSDAVNVSGIAWGRDNTGTYTDRWQGRYIVEYTQTPLADASTPDSAWQLIGEVDYATLTQTGNFSAPAMRHCWSFSPVQATAIRLRMITASGADNIALDELELYTSGPWLDILSITAVGLRPFDTSPMITEFGRTIYRSVIVRNIGPGPLTNLDVSLRGSINLSAILNGGATILPGQQTTLAIEFTPIFIESRTMTFSVGSSAATNRPPRSEFTFLAGVTCSPFTVFYARHAPFTVGTPVNYNFGDMVLTGHPTRTFTVISGSLPPGITLLLNGDISGTPTQAGRYTFRLRSGDGFCSGPEENFTFDVLNVALQGQGGTFAPRDLARGRVTLAKDTLSIAPYAPGRINDGSYGNASSWTAGTTDSFVGVSFGDTPATLNQVAFGRDNTGALTDRNVGTYTLQYTTVPNPDANTPDANWATLQALNYFDWGYHLAPTQPATRQRYSFAPVQATGFRIKVQSTNGSEMAIDELELYGPDPAPAWRTQYFGAATANTGDLDDFDGDGLPNLLEFATGTSPAEHSRNNLSYSGNVISPGGPVADASTAFFIRRRDHINAGITYTVEFSPDLVTWTPDSTVPSVVADDGTNQVVSVPMPPSQTRHFFRVKVQTAP